MIKSFQHMSIPSVVKLDCFKSLLDAYSFILIGDKFNKTNIRRYLTDSLSSQEKNKTLKWLKANNIVSVGLIKSTNEADFGRELELINRKIDFEKSHFTILLDYEEPKSYRSTTYRPSEESFLFSVDDYFKFFNHKRETGLCYDLMLKALDYKNGVSQILAHQIKHPNPVFSEKNVTQSAEVVIPHRGNLEELEELKSALWYLDHQHTQAQKVSVCFDEFVTNKHFELENACGKTRFYVNYPSGVGPYPARDKLARASEENLIIFQDSDDVSTIDRIAIQCNVLKKEGLDVVGSHELRVNKIDRRIEAIRFPLDVINVEDKANWHSIFFPTTTIRKSAYLKTGGLSTIRRHSSDSQFYWRAHFFLNIKNVDEFLYIRVKRENSLTTHSSTALGTTVRERLRRQWRMDFLKIRNRNIALTESTLIDEYNVADIKLISLEQKHRDLIMKCQEITLEMDAHSSFQDLPKPSFPREEEILENRLLDYKLIKEPGVAELKKSLSWRIGWKATRLIITLFGWIPFVKKRV